MVAMGSLSIWHWMAFAAIALFVFGGKGKISDIMGDVAKGVKAFKKGIADDEAPTPAPAPRPIDNRPAAEIDVGDKHKVG
jgi:sec-independent protein translocase protein TatA